MQRLIGYYKKKKIQILNSYKYHYKYEEKVLTAP
jgi:hypothetical protein